MRRTWTDAEIAELRRDYPFETASALARRLGRSADAIMTRASRLGITRPGFDPSRGNLALLRQLKGCGRSDPEIAEMLGTNAEMVRYWRLKLKIPAGGVSEHQRARRRALVRSQCVREGVASLAELRELTHRVGAARAGWPPEVTPAGRRILEALLARGSLSGPELRRHLGVRGEMRPQIAALAAIELIRVERRNSHYGGHLYSLATFADDEAAPKRLRRAKWAEMESP